MKPNYPVMTRAVQTRVSDDLYTALEQRAEALRIRLPDLIRITLAQSVPSREQPQPDESSQAA